MADATLSRLLAEFADGTTYEQLPSEVADSVRLRVLDTLGLAIRAQDLETSVAIRDYVLDQGGKKEATAIGIGTRVPAAMAALNNGVLAHSLDYDDTHLPSILHPSASVVPTALAAAETVGASGEELISAIAVGLEVCVRVGMAGYDAHTGNSTFFEHGQHATSICGAMGSAVAAGKLFGLDVNGLQSVLGITASFAAGIIEANRTGGTVKRLHCGWAAHSAITAADLTKRGFTGPPTVLEGRFGFFQAFLHGTYDPSQITAGLGESWSVPGIFFKPYPANHFTHTAIDAAAQLRREGIVIDDIISLTLGVPAPVIRTIGEPLAAKQAPTTGYQAQFSGPFAVAAGLLGGSGLEVGLEDFTDVLAVDPIRRGLMAKVAVVADDECSSIFPHQFPAVLTAHMCDGSTRTARILTNRGGPARPLSSAEIAVKFTDNARPFVDQARLEKLKTDVYVLQDIKDVTQLIANIVTITN